MDINAQIKNLCRQVVENFNPQKTINLKCKEAVKNCRLIRNNVRQSFNLPIK